MSNFTFNTTPKILCEPGAAAAIGTTLKNQNFQSVFLVTDPGIIKAGLFLRKKTLPIVSAFIKQRHIRRCL